MKEKFKRFCMSVAVETSKLSTAKRLQVGCIAVKGNRIISIGYNGTPDGWSNVCEDENNVTKPEVLHAEANCITKLARCGESSEGCDLFVTHAPCLECSKLIFQAGVKSVYYKTSYRRCDGIEFLKKAKIHIEHYNNEGI